MLALSHSAQYTFRALLCRGVLTINIRCLAALWVSGNFLQLFLINRSSGTVGWSDSLVAIDFVCVCVYA